MGVGLGSGAARANMGAKKGPWALGGDTGLRRGLAGGDGVKGDQGRHWDGEGSMGGRRRHEAEEGVSRRTWGRGLLGATWGWEGVHGRSGTTQGQGGGRPTEMGSRGGRG
uniref:Glycine-rich protein 23-like n=1 Tax=Elaeis guineensis var. tenera TaxID=51953 RepID=A0A6I9RL11_ELAGV|nr:glycine-rich protein 23-like [Elaeis guineensis]